MKLQLLRRKKVHYDMVPFRVEREEIWSIWGMRMLSWCPEKERRITCHHHSLGSQRRMKILEVYSALAIMAHRILSAFRSASCLFIAYLMSFVSLFLFCSVFYAEYQGGLLFIFHLIGFIIIASNTIKLNIPYKNYCEAFSLNVSFKFSAHTVS